MDAERFNKMEIEFKEKRDKYKERSQKSQELNEVKEKAKDLYDKNILDKRAYLTIKEMSKTDPYDKVKIVLDNIDKYQRIVLNTPDSVRQTLNEKELKESIEVLKSIDLMEQMGILRGLLGLGIPKGADPDLYLLSDKEFKKKMDDRGDKRFKTGLGTGFSPDFAKKMEEGGRTFGKKIYEGLTPKHKFYVDLAKNAAYWLNHIDKFINGVINAGTTLSDTYSFLKAALPSLVVTLPVIGGAVYGGYKKGYELNKYLRAQNTLLLYGREPTQPVMSYLENRQFNKDLKISQRRPLLKTNTTKQINELIQQTPQPQKQTPPPLGEFGPPQGHIIGRRGEPEYLKPFVNKEEILNNRREQFLRDRDIREKLKSNR